MNPSFIINVSTTLGPIAVLAGSVIRRGLKPTDVLYLLAGGLPV